jgi:hypothetical protein
MKSNSCSEIEVLALAKKAYTSGQANFKIEPEKGNYRSDSIFFAGGVKAQDPAVC